METLDIRSIGSDLARGARTSAGVEGSIPIFEPVLRLLARGRPATVDEIAAASGLDAEQVRGALDALGAVEWDADGRVVGFGITLNPTPHRFRVGDRQLFTWCALDTLAFPPMLGVAAQVESPCLATGTAIRLQVEPDRVESLEPAEAVVSLVPIDHAENIRTAFCDYVHFFLSADAAAPWLAQHPGARVLPVREAFSLGLSFGRGLRERAR